MESWNARAIFALTTHWKEGGRETVINRIPLIFSGREILTRNFRPGFPPPYPDPDYT